jgi:hypothetical protein
MSSPSNDLMPNYRKPKLRENPKTAAIKAAIKAAQNSRRQNSITTYTQYT